MLKLLNETALSHFDVGEAGEKPMDVTKNKFLSAPMNATKSFFKFPLLQIEIKEAEVLICFRIYHYFLYGVLEYLVVYFPKHIGG